MSSGDGVFLGLSLYSCREGLLQLAEMNGWQRLPFYLNVKCSGVMDRLCESRVSIYRTRS